MLEARLLQPPQPVTARRTPGRRTVATLAALALTATGAGAAIAATEVTVKNTDHLTTVGPVNAEHGFPAWYGDSTGTRVELCLDLQNPLCGLLPEEIPTPESPISFPENFPEEAFYMLAGSELDLPGGGSATLTLGLEAAFSNTVTAGDQVVFGRQRIVVKEGPANTTLTFQHPYGTVTVDTDAEGDGRLVEDISPANGNFTTALKSNIGPFLKWDTGAPEGYLGNPDVEHKVIGSPSDFNQFAVTGEGINLSTDLFTVQGKIATNHGVQADQAMVNGNMIDVFATSGGTQLQVEGQEGMFATTPMVTDDGSNRFYARIQLTGDTVPTQIKITNISDQPASSNIVDVTKPTGISVTQATYDGTQLTVAANSAVGWPLTVTGLGDLPDTQAVSWQVKAPPSKVTVTAANGDTASLPVMVTAGAATPIGLDPVDPAPDPGPVTDTGDGTTPTDPTDPGTDPVDPTGPGTDPGDSSDPGTDPVTPTDPVEPAPTDPETPAAPEAVASAASTSLARGTSAVLDGSASTGATAFTWSQISGPEVTWKDETTAKPTVTVPYAVKTSDTAPAAINNEPVKLQLIVTGEDGTQSAPATVELELQTDAVTIDAGARYRQGKEFRVNGTSTLAGNTAILTPATSVVIYDTTPGRAVKKLGTAQVDTLGNWSLRMRPAPSQAVSSVLVQSTRGGSATGTVSNR
jgi:hypothetical protein